MFSSGNDYSGYNPPLLKLVERPVWKNYVFEILADELHRTGDALIIPAGVAVSAVLKILVPDERCLTGFPHPSGNANKYRLRLPENKYMRDKLVNKVRAWYSRHS